MRWCEVVVSLDEGRAVGVHRFLARFMHFDAQGLLDFKRQLEEARFRMDASGGATTAQDLSPPEQLAREAKMWLDRQVIVHECEWEPNHDLRLVIENVALDPRPRLWLRPATGKAPGFNSFQQTSTTH